MPRRDHRTRGVKADPREQKQHPRRDQRGQAHRICLPRQAADQQSRLYRLPRRHHRRRNRMAKAAAGEDEP